MPPTNDTVPVLPIISEPVNLAPPVYPEARPIVSDSSTIGVPPTAVTTGVVEPIPPPPPDVAEPIISSAAVSSPPIEADTVVAPSAVTTGARVVFVPVKPIAPVAVVIDGSAPLPPPEVTLEARPVVSDSSTTGAAQTPPPRALNILDLFQDAIAKIRRK
ncbi:MAG: hypothetical protein A3C13_03825 [Candidatus Lloydbacteria bacterium RIFCSPHIGHO2_02_FULL_50_11]|nr:MAG: hypothetical protein A3C13_03825 [Candidatus Lloydbacteria bacterium RIFCSPHIGHO2_02_FULL_50_11]